jgi:hypothetical protein
VTAVAKVLLEQDAAVVLDQLGAMASEQLVNRRPDPWPRIQGVGPDAIDSCLTGQLKKSSQQPCEQPV